MMKELFPQAPKHTQEIDCFRVLSPETSMYMVAKICGRPDEEVGSGLMIFLYHMRDGSTVAIGTGNLNSILYVIYTDPSGKNSSLLRKKPPSLLQPSTPPAK
jgi:hypothetical protein